MRLLYIHTLIRFCSFLECVSFKCFWFLLSRLHSWNPWARAVTVQSWMDSKFAKLYLSRILWVHCSELKRSMVYWSLAISSLCSLWLQMRAWDVEIIQSHIAVLFFCLLGALWIFIFYLSLLLFWYPCLEKYFRW